MRNDYFILLMIILVLEAVYMSFHFGSKLWHCKNIRTEMKSYINGPLVLTYHTIWLI